MRELAYQGKIESLVIIIEEFLKKVLSNRDFRGFKESHLKVHILTLLHLTEILNIIQFENFRKALWQAACWIWTSW